MEPHKVVSHDDWIAARKAYLAEEKAFTKARDALSRKRRALPWEKVEKNYVFDYTERQTIARRSLRQQEPAHCLSLHARPRLGSGLPELFLSRRSFRRRGRPSRPARCRLRRHLARAAAEVETFQRRMGWKFKWLSSFGSDFNHDYQVSVSPQEKAAGEVYYNYELTNFRAKNGPASACSSRTAPAKSSTPIPATAAASICWSAPTTFSIWRRRAATRTA